jgi:hypothetical protein
MACVYFNEINVEIFFNILINLPQNMKNSASLAVDTNADMKNVSKHCNFYSSHDRRIDTWLKTANLSVRNAFGNKFEVLFT